MMKKQMSIAAIFSLGFLIACSDDDPEPEVNPLVGAYELVSATLNEETEFAGSTLPAGTDLTEMVEMSLYVESPCETGENTVIDLRADGTVYYACRNESTAAEQFGTWTTTADGKTLTMSLVVQGQPFPLILDNLEVSDAGVVGDATNYPLVDIQEDGSFTITPASVKINFSRVTL